MAGVKVDEVEPVPVVGRRGGVQVADPAFPEHLPRVGRERVRVCIVVYEIEPAAGVDGRELDQGLVVVVPDQPVRRLHAPGGQVARAGPVEAEHGPVDRSCLRLLRLLRRKRNIGVMDVGRALQQLVGHDAAGRDRQDAAGDQADCQPPPLAPVLARPAARTAHLLPYRSHASPGPDLSPGPRPAMDDAPLFGSVIEVKVATVAMFLLLPFAVDPRPDVGRESRDRSGIFATTLPALRRVIHERSELGWRRTLATIHLAARSGEDGHWPGNRSPCQIPAHSCHGSMGCAVSASSRQRCENARRVGVSELIQQFDQRPLPPSDNRALRPRERFPWIPRGVRIFR